MSQRYKKNLEENEMIDKNESIGVEGEKYSGEDDDLEKEE